MHALLRTKLLYYTNLFECQKSSFCSWCRHFSMDCMCTSLYSKSSNLNKWGCDNNTGVDFRLYQDGLPLFKTAQYGPKNNIGHALYYIGHIYRLHLLKYYNATAEWCRYSHELVSDIEHRIWLCKDIDIVLKVQCVAYKLMFFGMLHSLLSILKGFQLLNRRNRQMTGHIKICYFLILRYFRVRSIKKKSPTFNFHQDLINFTNTCCIMLPEMVIVCYVNLTLHWMKSSVEQHIYACEIIMRIAQNGPLENLHDFVDAFNVRKNLQKNYLQYKFVTATWLA